MKKKVSSEAMFLATLADVNRALAAARSPRAGLQRGLQILGHLYGVSRTSVVLQNPDTNRLEIEASEGLTAEGRKATWKAGEGITGRVVQTGRPVVVPYSHARSRMASPISSCSSVGSGPEPTRVV